MNHHVPLQFRSSKLSYYHYTTFIYLILYNGVQFCIMFVYILPFPSDLLPIS